MKKAKGSKNSLSHQACAWFKQTLTFQNCVGLRFSQLKRLLKSIQRRSGKQVRIKPLLSKNQLKISLKKTSREKLSSSKYSTIPAADFTQKRDVQRKLLSSNHSSVHRATTMTTTVISFAAGQTNKESKNLLGLSNMKVTESPPSSALIVMISSLPAHLSILAMLVRFIPIEMLRSHLKCSKPSDLSNNATSATWLESMACKEKPVDAQSKLASVTRSFMASKTFFNRLPCTSRNSNIFLSFPLSFFASVSSRFQDCKAKNKTKRKKNTEKRKTKNRKKNPLLEKHTGTTI